LCIKLSSGLCKFEEVLKITASRTVANGSQVYLNCCFSGQLYQRQDEISMLSVHFSELPKLLKVHPNIAKGVCSIKIRIILYYGIMNFNSVFFAGYLNDVPRSILNSFLKLLSHLKLLLPQWSYHIDGCLFIIEPVISQNAFPFSHANVFEISPLD